MADSTTSPTPLPHGIGKAATSALALEGVTTLDDLREADLDALLRLHGVGPKAIRLLREALGAAG